MFDIEQYLRLAADISIADIFPGDDRQVRMAPVFPGRGDVVTWWGVTV